MDWDRIAEDWAVMTRRLGNSGLNAPGRIVGPQDPDGALPEVGNATDTTEAAQAVVTVARRLAGI